MFFSLELWLLSLALIHFVQGSTDKRNLSACLISGLYPKCSSFSFIHLINIYEMPIILVAMVNSEDILLSKMGVVLSS